MKNKKGNDVERTSTNTVVVSAPPPQLLEDVEKSLANDLADIDQAAELINSLKIENPKDLTVAVQMTATVKVSYKELDEKRETWTKPLKGVIADINETFKPALMALETAESILKKKIVEFVNHADEERLRILDSIKDTPDAERSTLLVKADSLVLDKVPGLSIRTSEEISISDKTAAIRHLIAKGMHQFLDIDMKTLRFAYKEYGEAVMQIPGVEVSEKKTVAITVSKVE